MLNKVVFLVFFFSFIESAGFNTQLLNYLFILKFEIQHMSFKILDFLSSKDFSY